MRVEHQPAYVLHARAYRETSLLLECLTRDHGRVGLIARGVRTQRTRIPRALLQPLALIDLGWAGRGELAVLTSVDAVSTPPAFTGEGLFCALYLNELVSRLTLRHDPQPQLFHSYADTLNRLAGGAAMAWTLRCFERDLLAQLGYGLVLDIDTHTGAPLDPLLEYGYRHEVGPVRWQSAVDGPRLRGSALLALGADRLPSAEDQQALRRLMRAVIATYLDGGELRAWKMLDGIARRPQ
jgi:DNA repair protein RecO (recombination protein O)